MRHDADIRRMMRDEKREARFGEQQARFLEQLLAYDPILGTQLGLPGGHDALLPPSSRTERTQSLRAIRESVSDLKNSAGPNLAENTLIDVDLAEAGVRGLEIFEEALRPLSRDPSWYINTALSAVHSLLLRIDMPAETKIECLLSRLSAIPSYFERAQAQITEPPRVLVETAAGDILGALTFCREDLAEFISGISDDGGRAGLENALAASIQSLEGFANYLGGLTDRSVEEFAIGEPAFNALLKELHQLPYDAEELNSIGGDAVRGIEQELERQSLRVCGHVRWWEILEPLSDQHPTREGLLGEYQRMIDEAHAFVAERGLVDLACAPALKVQVTPAFARTNLPFAAYFSIPPFASTGLAQFWVTPLSTSLSGDKLEAALRQHNAGRILVIGVHEAYPGHHVQFSHAATVRRPLRHIFGSNVFIEGWAFYCEELMRTQGFKKSDPHYDLLQMAQLRDQLWRALRVVLDVGLHCRGMSRRDATSILVDKHVLDADSAASEVMYYCSAPTQPMSYMVGRLLVEALIKQCEAAGGDRFRSLPAIHNELLAHGSLPFPLLKRAMGVD